MGHILELPAELFIDVIGHFVNSVGITAAWHTRAVCNPSSRHQEKFRSFIYVKIDEFHPSRRLAIRRRKELALNCWYGDFHMLYRIWFLDEDCLRSCRGKHVEVLDGLPFTLSRKCSYSRQTNQVQLCKDMLQKNNIETQNLERALLVAADVGSHALVQLLLQHGANPKEDWGEHLGYPVGPLTLAVRNFNFPITRTLIEAGSFITPDVIVAASGFKKLLVDFNPTSQIFPMASFRRTYESYLTAMYVFEVAKLRGRAEKNEGSQKFREAVSKLETLDKLVMRKPGWASLRAELGDALMRLPY